MDFIKKNWGLLLYGLGCLALAVVIGRNIHRAAKQASAKRQALDEQMQWFDGVKKDNFKLTQENESAARDNRDHAERKFTELRQDMANRYHIDPRSPPTPVEAVRELQSELKAIGRMLTEAEPPVDYQACPYFSFDARAASETLPSMEDVPKIFRQLRIVREIARIAAAAHLVSLDSIARPMDLNVIEEDLYTATPITLTVSGTADQVQTFINKMATEANYLFFLRNITLTTLDQAPNGAVGASGGAAGAAGGLPGGGLPGKGAVPGGGGLPGRGGALPGGGGLPGRGGALPGRGGALPFAGPGPAMGGGVPGMGNELPGAGRAPRVARRAGPAGAGLPGVPGAVPGLPDRAGPAGAAMPGLPGPGGVGIAGATGATDEPMYREQLRAFVPDALVTADLRFDLIEFNQPEADGAGKTSEDGEPKPQG
jgi:hypothetical protein